MKKPFISLATTLLAAVLAAPAAGAADAKPTIILVHGAFADSSSWDGVMARLQKDGYPVIGAANPLRSVKGDAAYVAGIVKSVPGPVILVGHSYGGSVISAAVQGNANVKGLVYVAAFAPESGESAAGLSGKFPGSTLGPALAPPVALADGGKDLYIQPARFRDQFAADVPAPKAQQMAAGQRPITDAALNEASPAPAWKTLPSWFIYGKADKNIPAAAQDFMAKRARSKKTVVVDGASHVVMTSHPTEVAALIEEAASSAK
ncbi:pimeloyl-ACP methyl ester carboxylesterase [Pseudoduganella lurida]|uniref:Pimeloyl-ACP methyl ester carboxylesterase n=1 Tax=Pseudoduganella lurida TaxID=1036180 RepID=A0A562R668_9BURK|nr:alpha/beta hydrolase [Pseudoduganella lurida]TWI64353.1 pimeloyl-ACP methyl ester carboxylesterase [Pseudoduganella lurida]